MGLHKPFDRDFFLVNGNIGLAGSGSTNLAKGQFAIVDTNNPLPTGARVVTNFAGASPQTNYQIRVGKAPVSATRTAQNSKPYSSHNWKISDVRDIRVSAPKTSEQKFDEWIVGYNGINDASAIKFTDGQTTSLDIILSGLPIGYKGVVGAGNEYGQYSFKIHFGKEVGQTDQEVIEKAVEEIKERKFGDGNKLTDLVDIKIVNSDNVALVGTAYNFASLTITDSGDSNALAMVQAQYLDYKVKVTDRVGQQSVYTILKPASVTLAAYTTNLPSKIKGCGACDAGYTALNAGIVTMVTLEDDGVDLKASIQALPGAVALTAVKKGNKDGVGTYTVVTAVALTEAQKATFIAGVSPNNTAVFTLIGDVVAVCSNATVASTGWVNGLSCTASTEAYSIQLKDTTCGTSRLAELQASYPTLVITETVNPLQIAGCQRVYNTSVVTNVLCAECSPIFQDTFASVEPQSYQFISWTKVDKVYSATSKMGIKFKAKPFILDPEEFLRDDVPFYETSVRIVVAGGELEEVNYTIPSYKFPFAVKQIGWQEDRDHLGGNLRWKELQSMIYFDGEIYQPNNNFRKAVLGQESTLDFRKQYVDYAITIGDSHYSQGFGHRLDTAVTYHAFVEVGRQAPLEALINSLAVKAGLPTVQAFGAN